MYVLTVYIGYIQSANIGRQVSTISPTAAGRGGGVSVSRLTAAGSDGGGPWDTGGGV